MTGIASLSSSPGAASNLFGPGRRLYRPISDYAIIGDGRTAALIAKDGSIDWLCCERFDRAAVLCRLLDAKRGGYFQVRPAGRFESSRSYAVDSNVLETEFTCAGGRLRVTDAMLLDSPAPSLVRRLECLSGHVQVQVEWMPTFDFARSETVLEHHPAGSAARSGSEQLFLSCPFSVKLYEGRALAAGSLRQGQTCWFGLSRSALAAESMERGLEHSRQYWQAWSRRSTYQGKHHELVSRSALVLKLLIHAETGSMVAAPTTSLPETLGGERNWDYRFAWLRDASWLVSALMMLGYHEESMQYLSWLESLNLAEQRPLVLYTLDGAAAPPECTLDGLSGYRGARPVRIGNAAGCQRQHDILGEVIAAVELCSDAMREMRPLSQSLWRMVSALAERACRE